MTTWSASDSPGVRGAGIVALLVVVIAGCATSPAARYRTDEEFSYSGRRRDATPVAELILTDETFALTVSYVPGMRISGVVDPGSDIDGTRLYVTAVNLFANWENGWTELEMEASGVMLMRYGMDFGPVHRRMLVSEPIELWNLTAGAIRYFDSYILGEDGLRRGTARFDRLAALAGWLHEQGGPEFYADGVVEDVWSRIGLAASATPPARAEDSTAVASGDRDAAIGSPDAPGTAELPEWLVMLVDSGSLERDLREAPSMLRAIYNLEYVNGHVLEAVQLKER